jgi:antitoxin component of MazEF toxin-antitoxin module
LIVKIRKQGENVIITLPTKLRKELGPEWDVGEYVYIGKDNNDNSLIITPVSEVYAKREIDKESA